MMIWLEDLDFKNKEEIYVLTRLFFGLKASAALAHLSLIMMAEYAEKRCECSGADKGNTACNGLAHQFRALVDHAYVDDIMHSVDTETQRDKLIVYSEHLLNKFRFKTKGWTHNGKINMNEEQMVDSKGEIGLGGYKYNGEDDYFRIKAPSQHKGRK